MSDIQEGVVIKLEADFARVQVSGHSDCDSCGTCNVAGMLIITYNPLNAVLGQKVKFTNPEGGMLKIAFMIFILPLISLFAGLYTGSILSDFYHFNQTLTMTVFGLMYVVLSVVIIFSYDKKYKQYKANFPQIIEIIK